MPISTFPNIKPNFVRPIELPEYSLKSTEWQSGQSNVVREAFTGIKTQISLEYQHLDHLKLVEIVNFYNSVKGTSTGFLLPIADIEVSPGVFEPQTFLQFPDAILNAIADLGSTTVWKFASEPSFSVLVATTEKGKYNGSIQLISTGEQINEGNELDPIVDPVYSVAGEPIPEDLPDNTAPTDPDPILPEVDDPIEDATSVLAVDEDTIIADGTIQPGENLYTTVVLSVITLLLKATCTEKIRLRLYLSESKRVEDVDRENQIINTPNHGLLFDCTFDGAITTINTTPGTILWNADNGSNEFFATITNLDTVPISDVQIDFVSIAIQE